MAIARLSSGLLACAIVCAVSASAALGSAFVAWRVTGVGADDLLNVRAYPSSASRILIGYADGTTLSMTGRCTGQVRLDEIQSLPVAVQRQMVRYSWCETWIDPDGNGEYRTGWVYGRFIAPA